MKIKNILDLFDKNIGNDIEAIFQSLILSSVLSLFNTAFGTDYKLLVLIVVGVFFDSILGIIKAYKLQKLNAFDYLLGQCLKLCIVLINIFVFHTIAYIVGAKGYLYDYLIMSGNISGMLYVSWSIFDNMYILTNKKFPPKHLFDKLNAWFRTGDIKIDSNG